ncbi:MAG: thermonuclease family protein [Scytolyngbya sp. HA4215-MV1]|nr:thermonuclease family protein [Scytolyngbya sp. HA4215-MV1]
MRRIQPFVIFYFGFLMLMGCQTVPPPQGFEAQVAEVVSGQTLEVAGGSGQPEVTERVRLIGIDAPDLKQDPWGEQAKTQLEKLIGDRPVLLESDVEPREVNGRRLAYVWQNGILINEKLVAGGNALAIPHPPNHKYDLRLSRAQDQARILGLGIWNPQQPLTIAPADFRRQNR